VRVIDVLRHPIGVHERLGVHVVSHADLPDLAESRRPGSAARPAADRSRS
jgi:hypothetical protein